MDNTTVLIVIVLLNAATVLFCAAAYLDCYRSRRFWARCALAAVFVGPLLVLFPMYHIFRMMVRDAFTEETD